MNQTPGGAVLVVVLALPGWGYWPRFAAVPAAGTAWPVTARK